MKPCKCRWWSRDGELPGTTHHKRCPHYAVEVRRLAKRWDADREVWTLDYGYRQSTTTGEG